MVLLRVDNLRISYPRQWARADHPAVPVLHGVSFELESGRTLGIVGESGAGKTQIGRALMGLLEPSAQIQGEIWLDQEPLMEISPAAWRQIRGRRVGMIFQDPMAAFHPCRQLGVQMEEVLVYQMGMERIQARAEIKRMVDLVQIPDAAQVLDRYPHACSGGMLQRMMIAMALLCRPAFLIADEPTTALDPVAQTQIMALLAMAQRTWGIGILLITHDWGVAAGMCDDMLVLYAGWVMEYARTEEIFGFPQHPYTRSLLAAWPRLDHPIGQPLPTVPGEPGQRGSAGCPFAPRCPVVQPICHQESPAMTNIGLTHAKACHAEIWTHDGGYA